MKPAIGGFTTVDVEGHGFDFSSASLGERVRGRVERQMLLAVLPRTLASSLLDTISQELPVPHMAFWLEPVLEFGRLTGVAQVAAAKREGAMQ